MSVDKMPRAPRSHRSSITRWASSRRTIDRTATQPSRCSGETVGLSNVVFDPTTPGTLYVGASYARCNWCEMEDWAYWG